MRVGSVFLPLVKRKVSEGKRDQDSRMIQAKAAYERIDERIYPGTITLLSTRIVALNDVDASEYQGDIEALLDWYESITKKELDCRRRGYELADRQPGGGAWQFWDRGSATERAEAIARTRTRLTEICEVLDQSEKILRLPTP